jgi:hypothetical protein
MLGAGLRKEKNVLMPEPSMEKSRPRTHARNVSAIVSLNVLQHTWHVLIVDVRHGRPDFGIRAVLFL